MRLKRVLAIVLAAGMACASLTACGSKTAESSAADTSGATTAADTTKADDKKEGSGEKKVLSVTTWDYDSSPQFQAVVDAYMKENPNVEIKVIDTSADEYNNSLGISLSAAQPDPDIIWVKDMGSMLQMADKKQLLPLDDFMKKDSFDTSVYNGAAEQLQYNGVTYGLPYRSDWYVLYYNKDLFDAAGVAYPSNDMTWDEYNELAAKMTSGEGSSKVYGGHNHTWQALVTNWAVQDGKHTVVDKDYSFLKPWYESALSLQDNGYIQDYSTLKTANIHYSSVFKNQQCAMMPMGTWFISTMIQSRASDETSFNWGIARIPHPADTETGYTVGALTPLGISAYTDEPDLSWDFVKFATSKEAANILAEQGVFTGIQTEESLKTIASAQFFPEGESNIEALSYTHYSFDRPLDPQIEEIRKVLDEVHEMIMIKQYTVDQGIEELNKRVAEIKGW
ncbi:ABC transporter substrate-binding protein [Lacrimispora saccharolytica]|uniref:Extracellular solute-binding protein family 1 n=1 Tax=Lacrimispora saccharolytica (strain ATCC 35040 / DSM 2544 / NRCC 2533 / WM1) TaxID=610130 RepID=D9R054_LACSW|nr:sugar ABC transporter substrate-binding protein [Lacrimispora saccharolytica]ADL04505.1 extracellular solute-binding protein family 1 [[Clostridium] saccharolyticum WM1]QRV21238.1 sugar ABC transporter substrate-binding protein [Lacrimispora saccharolytica]